MNEQQQTSTLIRSDKTQTETVFPGFLENLSLALCLHIRSKYFLPLAAKV
jgi:hypothetical protein